MSSFLFNRTISFRFAALLFSFFTIFAFSAATLSAQTKSKKPAAKKPVTVSVADLPKVTQVDVAALQNLLKREGENTKPLLVNFWATWCAPCVEEFPDLVKINNDYQGKLDVITVTLDDLAEIETSVPQFLAKMKATMPAYLLKTADENAAIEAISKDWQGGLPFTILYDGKGTAIYAKQAKFAPDILRHQIDEVLNKQHQTSAFEQGKSDAQQDITNGKLVFKVNYNKPFKMNYVGDIRSSIFPVEKSYGIEILGVGNLFDSQSISYLEGYNSITDAEIERKFGEKALNKLKSFYRINHPANVDELNLTKK